MKNHCLGPVEEKQKLYSDDPANTSFNVNKEKVHTGSLEKYVPESNPPQVKNVIFSKSLSKTDIKARLAVPTGALKHIKMPDGGNYVYTKDSDGKEWKFRYYTRLTGHPKLVFIGGWRKFVKAKGLQIDDQVTLSALDE